MIHVLVNLTKIIFVCAFVQGAECGEGLRRRNLSCVVHWGDWPESPPQPVEEEFCGDKLRKQIQQEMEQPCFVPCPGKAALKIYWINIFAFQMIYIQYVIDVIAWNQNFVIGSNRAKLHDCMNYLLLLSFWIHNTHDYVACVTCFIINNLVFERKLICWNLPIHCPFSQLDDIFSC